MFRIRDTSTLWCVRSSFPCARHSEVAVAGIVRQMLSTSYSYGGEQKVRAGRRSLCSERRYREKKASSSLDHHLLVVSHGSE